MRYSEKFKEEMVRKLLGPGAMSLARLSAETGVATSTLWKWRNQATTRSMTDTPNKAAKRWSAEEKLRVMLEAAAAGETGRGELLRREGLHEADLVRFQADALESMKTKPEKRRPADKKRIKELERNLRRKDRALAEATALVVLSKKLNAYFEEVEVGDTTDGSEE